MWPSCFANQLPAYLIIHIGFMVERELVTFLMRYVLFVYEHCNPHCSREWYTIYGTKNCLRWCPILIPQQRIFQGHWDFYSRKMMPALAWSSGKRLLSPVSSSAFSITVFIEARVALLNLGEVHPPHQLWIRVDICLSPFSIWLMCVLAVSASVARLF